MVNANTSSPSHGDSNDNINENPFGDSRGVRFLEPSLWDSQDFGEVSNISQLNVFHPCMFFLLFEFHTV
jgi:hypothetical protein